MSQLTPGSYFGKLIDAGLGEVGDKGTPAMILTFSLTHFAENGKWSEMTEVSREVQFFMTDAAKEYAFNDLRALGFNGDMAAPKFADDVHSGLEIDVWIEQYNNKPQEKLKIARLKKARERKPVNADTMRSLQAQFKQAGQNAARPSTPPPSLPRAPASQPQPSAGARSDEPPF